MVVTIYAISVVVHACPSRIEADAGMLKRADIGDKEGKKEGLCIVESTNSDISHQRRITILLTRGITISGASLGQLAFTYIEMNRKGQNFGRNYHPKNV